MPYRRHRYATATAPPPALPAPRAAPRLNRWVSKAASVACPPRARFQPCPAASVDARLCHNSLPMDKDSQDPAPWCTVPVWRNATRSDQQYASTTSTSAACINTASPVHAPGAIRATHTAHQPLTSAHPWWRSWQRCEQGTHSSLTPNLQAGRVWQRHQVGPAVARCTCRAGTCYAAPRGGVGGAPPCAPPCHHRGGVHPPAPLSATTAAAPPLLDGQAALIRLPLQPRWKGGCRPGGRVGEGKEEGWVQARWKSGCRPGGRVGAGQVEGWVQARWKGGWVA